MSELTPEQQRVLAYCADQAGWTSLVELERMLEPDDVLTVPSLVEAGLLEHRVTLGTVRATEAGRRTL